MLVGICGMATEVVRPPNARNPGARPNTSAARSAMKSRYQSFDRQHRRYVNELWPRVIVDSSSWRGS